MSEFKDFICNSELDKPRTITYGHWTLESAGEGGNRYIHLMHDDEEAAFMWVDTHFYKACFIHSVQVMADMAILHDWLNNTCDVCTNYHWEYNTWESVDKLMNKIVNFMKKSR